MKKKYFILFFLIPIISLSQVKDGLEICVSMQSNNFTSDKEADNALNQILSVIGVSKNFILIPCNQISNAVATSYKGIRYILYDKKFMQLINEKTNDWSNISILAHEVGHHINGHTIDLTMYKIVEPKTLKQRKDQELEADEFSGFVLQKLGASLSQAQSVMKNFSTDENDEYSTHPSKSKRLNAIKIGYNKSLKMIKNNKNIYKSDNEITQTKESRIKLWAGLLEQGDYTKSLEEFEKQFCCNIESQKLLWSGITSDGYYSKSFEEFKIQFFADYL